MSRRRQREQLDEGKAQRTAALAWLAKHEPADPLLALAFWSDIADHAQDRMTEKAIDAHNAGHSYGVLGMAYGDRTQGAAHSRFARFIAGE